MRAGGKKIERIYFGLFHVRGGDWWGQPVAWQKQGPAQFPYLTDGSLGCFPEGHLDTESGQWVVCAGAARHWPRDLHNQFMDASIRRGTFAPMVPPQEVLTKDGLIAERGLEVMFVGGHVLHRHHWDTSKLLARRMILWHRYGAWNCYDKNGRAKIKRYGDRHVPIREYASHAAPLAWCVIPADGAPLFDIPGAAFNTQHSSLYIEDPSKSLVTIDGRRLTQSTPPVPSKELEVPA